jgi:hypothetical protein
MNKRILYIVVILLGITLSYWAYKVFSAKKEETLPQHVFSKKSLELPKSAPPEELDTIFAPKSADKDFTEEAKAEYDFKSYEKRLSLLYLYFLFSR